MWQAQAKLLATMADVRTAVNLRIMIEQARTRRSRWPRRRCGCPTWPWTRPSSGCKDTEVYAPSDGLVQEVMVKKGQIISSGITTFTGGTALLTLADVGKLYVVSDVDEADIGRVRELAPRSGRRGSATSCASSCPSRPSSSRWN